MNVSNALAQSQKFFLAKEYARAQSILEDAASSYPNSAEILSNLSYLAYLQGNFQLGESWSRRAVSADKKFAPAYAHLALCLTSLHRFSDAENVLTTAIELGINDAQIYTNLGLVYQAMYQTNLAITAFNKALVRAPNQVEATTNLASSYLKIGETDHALRLYLKTLNQLEKTDGDISNNDHTLSSGFFSAVSNYLLCLQYMPNIGSYQLKNDACEKISLISEQLYSSSTEQSGRKPQQKNDKLRVGFVSADFRSHPITWFLLETYRQLGKIVDCYAYYNSAINDKYTGKFKKYGCEFRVILGKSDKEVKQKIIEDKIDVLIDLSGHTAGNRLLLFNLKPADKHYTWFGYAASTGIKAFDGVILGQDIVQPSSSSFFIEPIKTIDADHFSYTPPDYTPDISPCPFEKNGYITFGSFNNTSKLNIDVLRTWALALLKIKKSKLVLKWQSFADQSIRKTYLRKMIALGIDENRLDFRGPTNHEQHLKDYGDIDISLDPFPFCGALTTCESLLMGVPVITLTMERPLSRQSLTINQSLGLEDFCAETPSEYIKICTTLSSSLDRLKALRVSLRKSLVDTSKMNSKKQAKAIYDLLVEETKQS